MENNKEEIETCGICKRPEDLVDGHCNKCRTLSIDKFGEDPGELSTKEKIELWMELLPEDDNEVLDMVTEDLIIKIDEYRSYLSDAQFLEVIKRFGAAIPNLKDSSPGLGRQIIKNLKEGFFRNMT